MWTKQTAKRWGLFILLVIVASVSLGYFQVEISKVWTFILGVGLMLVAQWIFPHDKKEDDEEE